MSTTKRRVGYALAALLGAYAAVSAVIMASAPLPPSELTPRAGDVLRSASEGFEQTVLREEAGILYSELVLRPGAAGPPLHRHASFVEEFTVVEGTLSVELESSVRTVRRGESYRAEVGTLHRPFNATGERVVIHGSIPATFATCLTQLYGYLDARVENRTGVGPLLQLSLMRRYCDTHVAPAPVEALLMGALAPLARLSGRRSFYPEYRLAPSARLVMH